MKNTFYVSCPIDTYSGYGARSRDFVKALVESNKYIVKVIPQRWGSTPFGFIEDHSEKWGFLKNHLVALPLVEQPDIWCQITVPNEFQPIGKYNIGLTAGIETTACAPSWIEGCNKMDLILTSSNHSKKVFEHTSFNVEKNGQTSELKITKPVQVLMEGADLDVYRPDNKPCMIDFDIPESFAYLFVGHWMQGDLGEDRKNVGLLIKAFYEVFKNKKKKPALILKTSGAGASHMDRQEIQKRIASIRNSVPSNDLPNVYLLHGEFSDEEMNSLYNHSKVKAMISLTKGEGFGRPLLEFSLVNKPIITTGWSGHVDFLNPEFTALMGGNLTNVHPSAANDFLLKESQWFSVDHSHVGHFMSDVFQNYKDWSNRAKRQGFFSRNAFSYSKMKEQLVSILDSYVPQISIETNFKMPKIKKIELPKKEKVNG